MDVCCNGFDLVSFILYFIYVWIESFEFNNWWCFYYISFVVFYSVREVVFCIGEVILFENLFFILNVLI